MEIMKPYRARIDAVDDKIIDLLVERIGIIREVGHFKARENIPAVLPDRVIEVRERAAERAAAKGLDPELVRQLYGIIINYSCNLEEKIKEQEKAA
jgi:chorismate mutase-like protein